MTHDRERLEELAAAILDLVGDRAEAEVRVAAQRSGLTRFANSSIHQNVAGAGASVRVKVVVGGRPAVAGTSRVKTGLDGLVDRALAAARLRPVDPGWPGVAPPATVAPTGGFDDATLEAGPDVRAAIVKDFVTQGDRTLAAGFCETGGREIVFANTAGHRAWGHTTKAVIEGIHRTLSADGGGRQIAGRVADLDGDAAGRTAAGKARASDGAIDVDPGEWEVILEPNCVVDMLDFLVGHGFNAKEFAEGQSFVRLGESQFDKSISIFDDANDPRTVGLPFDAEGTPRRRLDLVTAGVSTALAHDRRSARAAGTASTGHAVPGGDISGPSARHLFLQPGVREADDLIGSVRRGLLISDFWYTRILDPKTQVVTGLTRNGTFLIENGRATRPVRNLRFTQSYLDALAPGRVLGVGSDGRLAGESQYFAPTLHLKAWNFTGGAKG